MTTLHYFSPPDPGPLLEHDRCGVCGNLQFVEDWHNGDTVCVNCGACSPERLIDCENEAKRNFSSDFTSSGRKKDNSTTSKADEFLGMVGTMIQSTPFSTDGDSFNSLRSLQNRQIDNKSRRVQEGLISLGSLCASLRLSDVVKNIASSKWNTFEKARKKHARGGDNFLYAALIYMACREAGTARSFDEIANGTGLEKKEIVRCYKRLDKEEKNCEEAIASPVMKHKRPGTSDSVSDAIKSRIDRISQTLNLKYPTVVKAKLFVEPFSAKLEGKKPDTIAAACISVVLSKESSTLPQKSVAKAASISTNTLRNALEQLV